MAAWSEVEIRFVQELHEKGKSRHDIADMYKEEFGLKRTPNSIKHCIETYQDYNLSEEVHIDSLKRLHSVRKAKSKVAKHNKVILEAMEDQESFLDAFKAVLETSEFKIHPVVKKVTKRASKRTIVAHISDTHFGAEIDSEEMGGLNVYTNIEEARRLAFSSKKLQGINKSIGKILI